MSLRRGTIPQPSRLSPCCGWSWADTAALHSLTDRHRVQSTSRCALPLSRPWIKRLAQTKVQAVNGQRQPAEHFRVFGIGNARLHALFHPTETKAQGRLFIRIPEFSQQPLDFLRPPECRTNDTTRRRGFNQPGLHLLQQQTFKLATVFGSIGVNPAAAAVQCGARLLKSRTADFRLPIRLANSRTQTGVC